MDTMVGLWAQGFKVSSPYAYPKFDTLLASRALLRA